MNPSTHAFKFIALFVRWPYFFFPILPPLYFFSGRHRTQRRNFLPLRMLQCGAINIEREFDFLPISGCATRVNHYLRYSLLKNIGHSTRVSFPPSLAAYTLYVVSRGCSYLRLRNLANFWALFEQLLCDETRLRGKFPFANTLFFCARRVVPSRSGGRHARSFKNSNPAAYANFFLSLAWLLDKLNSPRAYSRGG